MSETSKPCSTRLAHPFQYQSRPQVALPKKGDERAVHHRQELMRRLNGLLNQGAIQQGKVNFLLKLPSIGTLAQRAVATQIGEVDFAHHDQDC